MPADLPPSSPDDPGRPASVQRIRDTALAIFATRGSESTSLRTIADAAGVSTGLVQHHFGTKANLVQAVEDHVMTVLTEALAGPLVSAPDDPVADAADRVISLLSGPEVVVDYMSRALAENTAVGARIFDTLVDICTGYWEELRQQGLTQAGLDPVWITLSPLTLVLGTFILRSHLSRYLPDALTTPEQLERWRNATERIIAGGQLQRPAGNG